MSVIARVSIEFVFEPPKTKSNADEEAMYQHIVEVGRTALGYGGQVQVVGSTLKVNFVDDSGDSDTFPKMLSQLWDEL